MEWADEVHRGVPGQESRTAAIFKQEHDIMFVKFYEEDDILVYIFNEKCTMQIFFVN